MKNKIVLQKGRKMKMIRERDTKKRNWEKTLSWFEVSRFFHLPIEAAARELNIGLTALKFNCRELGFRRWPHRRIRSLQNLIKYYQDSGEEGLMEKEQVRQHEERLKRDIDSVKRNPDIELQTDLAKTKQKSYKDAYKKKARAAQIITELAAF